VWLLALLPRRGLLGLKPGDVFEIKLGRKQLRLEPVGGEEVEAWGPRKALSPGIPYPLSPP
jgi:hypothetical protein